jgi:adhesin transport system outer membrane protein
MFKAIAQTLAQRFSLFLALALLLVSSAYAQTLQSVIATSLDQHPAVLAQRATLHSSNANLEAANWQYFPTPSVSVEGVNASRRDYSYQGDERVTILRLQQPLWTGGRLAAGVEKAEASLQQAQASEKEVRKQLAVRVVQAYSDWLSASLRLQVAQRSLETHRKLGKQVQRRAEAGASAESERALVSVRMDAISAEVAMLHGQMSAARTRIALLTGLQMTEIDLAKLQAAPLSVSLNVTELQELAIQNSPSLERARSAERVSAANVDERKADLWPQVYLRLERQFGNYAILHSDPATRYFVGFNSALGAGLSNQAAVGSALAQQQAAQKEIGTQELSVRDEVLADHAQLTMLEERGKAIKSSVELAGGIVEAYLRQFLAGRKTWPEVMNAVREESQYQSQSAELDAARILLSWRLAINTYGLDAVLDGER